MASGGFDLIIFSCKMKRERVERIPQPSAGARPYRLLQEFICFSPGTNLRVPGTKLKPRLVKCGSAPRVQALGQVEGVGVPIS